MALNLILDEDFNAMENVENIVPKNPEVLGIQDSITANINGEFETISAYNGLVEFMENSNISQEVIDIVKYIINDEYTHIGQLQKALQLINPIAANSIDAGEEATAGDVEVADK